MHDYKAMLQRVSEFGADPLQLLAKAENIRKAALEDGTPSDKIHQREGVLECVERSQQAAIGAVRLQFDIYKFLVDQAEKSETTSVECRLILNGAVDMGQPEEMQHYG